MNRIYFDNAATSWPKPPEVYSSVLDYMTNNGFTAGRSVYSGALNSNRIIYNSREAAADFFNFNKPSNVVFTNNITLALNMLIKGTIKENWHVITTSMEHNSILRPLHSHKKVCNYELEILECSKEGFLDVELLQSRIKSNTKLVIMSHSSNVTGSIQPLELVGKLCKKNNVLFVIDSAQTAGSIPLDFELLNCNAIAFTGHKGLLAPQGIGGFVIDDKLNESCSTIIEGGTGSSSYDIYQPDFLPDKFESGTINTPSVLGLLKGIEFINKTTLKAVHEHEMELVKEFISDAENLKGITIYNCKDFSKTTPVISFSMKNFECSEIGSILDSEFNIMCRTGLHCAPLAHKTIGTYPEGTVRFSFGPFNTLPQVKSAVDALYRISKGSDSYFRANKRN